MPAGRKHQAPRRMQPSGLEWLFLMVSEPRRLGARYRKVSPRLLRLHRRQRARRPSGQRRPPTIVIRPDFVQHAVVRPGDYCPGMNISRRLRAYSVDAPRWAQVLAVAFGSSPLFARVLLADGAATGVDFLWLATRRFWARETIYDLQNCSGGDGFPATSAECTAYLHPYPFLTGPFATLPFEAAASAFLWVNLLAVPVLLLLLARANRLPLLHTFGLAAVFGISLGAYNTLVNGQAGVLTVLLLVALPLMSRPAPGWRPSIVGLVAGIGAFKLSLSAPFIALYLVAQRRIATGLVLTLATTAGFSMFWSRAPWWETLLGPLSVSAALGEYTRTRSSGDLHRILADLGVGTSVALTGGLTIAAVVTVWVVWFVTRDIHASAAGAAVVALLAFPHFPYDYLIIVVTLAYALGRLDRRTGVILAAVSALLLASPQYAFRAIQAVLPSGGVQSLTSSLAQGFAWPMSVAASRVTFALLVVALVLVLRLVRPVPTTGATDDPPRGRGAEEGQA